MAKSHCDIITWCVLRYGPALDVFNPALGFLAMFLAGLAHGLYPSLSTLDSLRSLAGSVAPFAFAFSRLSRRWSQNIINAICWVPIVSVVGGGALDLAGLRPIFFESGGERLAGLGHPAFLGGLCLTAIYACLIELYRDGKSRSLILLAVNALLLPFHERPLHVSALHFVLPYGMSAGSALGWSSFPSDNAALFFGLATCLWLVWRPAGALAFCQTFLVVAVARVYVGLHTPTDILGGAVLGIGLVELVRVRAIRLAVTRKPIAWLNRSPESFYPALFLALFMIASTFEPLWPAERLLRDVGRTALSRVASVVHHGARPAVVSTTVPGSRNNLVVYPSGPASHAVAKRL